MATDESNSDVPTLGVGMLGYAFMGKAHTNAYKTMDYSCRRLDCARGGWGDTSTPRSPSSRGCASLF